MYTLISNVVNIPDSSTWNKKKRVSWRIFSSPNVRSCQLFFCRVSAPLELGTTTENWNEKENRGNWDVMKGKCYINQAYICGGLPKYDSMAKRVLNCLVMWMLFIRFSIFGRTNVSANVVRKFLHTKCVCIWPDTCA